MVHEVIKFLAPKKNGNYIDCTLGLGGHAEMILEKNGPKGKLLAIDQDSENINEAKEKLKKFKDRIVFICRNFRHLDKIVGSENFPGFSGILFDLGLASTQIDNSEKGISYLTNSLLDMRLDPSLQYTAADIINRYSEKQIANIFYEYGDVRGNRNIARKIVFARDKKPVKTTRDLVEIIGTTNPKILAPVFQALRIEVNHELENLHEVLPQALELLLPKGRIVVISYHSGEDRIVKNFFRSNKSKLAILTKKPIIASNEEVVKNSRSRSAKLRAAEKI